MARRQTGNSQGTPITIADRLDDHAFKMQGQHAPDEFVPYRVLANE